MARGAGGWLESACKGILTFRAGILLITVVALWGEDGDRTLPAAAILVAAVTTAIPLRYWDRVGPVLVRHPGYLAGELVLATLILLMTGVNSPFFYYTLSTALLGGLVYGWAGAGLFSVMLIGVYFWVWSIRDEEAATLVMPAFYPLIACAGAALRGLLDRQAETESELASQSEDEARARHARLAGQDGVGHGLRRARARAPDRARPGGAADEARRLADDARQATREARRSSSGCAPTRASSCPWRPRSRPRRGAGASRAACRCADGRGSRRAAPGCLPRARVYLREALGNVERHARADKVTVRLRRLGGRAG